MPDRVQMPSAATSLEEDKIDLMQIISLVLSIYILGALTVETLFKIPHDVEVLLGKIDFFICFFFLYDFSIRFHRAESKMEFLRWGWIDFVSSIPVWGVFQWARLARVVRILRAIRSTKILVRYLFRNRKRGTLATAVLIAILMVIFSSIAILNFEDAPDSNIKNADDALWWAFTTISTVGYGDKYPVTDEGRLIASLLITCGVGLFGVYTAFIASLFVAGDKKDGTEIKDLVNEICELRFQIEQMKTQLEKQETKT